jgi:hypothetical protein
LLFVSHSTWCQLNPNRINFGQLKYDLTGESLTQEELESILNTFSSFGDKSVILEEVMKSYLIEPNTDYADSLIDFWLSDFSVEDSIQLMQLPAIKENFRERAFNVVWMSSFAKAYLEKIAFIEAHINLAQDKPSKFPNLPDMSAFSGMVAGIYSFYSFSKWSIQYPNEYQYFEDLMKQYTVTALGGQYSDEKLKQFIDIVINDVKDRRLVYELYLPFSLADYLKYRSMEEEDEDPKMKHCNPQEIDIFLRDAYKEVFNETLSEEGLLVLSQYIKDNNLYSPQVIYLALILSKYE